ncbi:hypothetical protein V6N13_117152 [Hibiscus sabdariffa]|uniref:Clp R domain-containing protein n=1 Tax=Hibiscus sabdariffa TaxID=183260 RepID=A0ABR2QHJ4_9ROSI
MMARVVAQSALLTGHAHGPSKEIEKAKRSVRMAYGLQTPVLRIRSDSICLHNKSVKSDSGQHFPSPITISPRLVSGSRWLAKEAKFEGFTEKAIEAIMLAREESSQLGDDSVNGEHILLGLIGEGTGIAAKALKSMGIKLNDARKHVITGRDRLLPGVYYMIIPRDEGIACLGFEFTPLATNILVFSFEEARRLGHNHIGPEHLLLGLLRCCESGCGGVAACALEGLGVDSSICTQVVIRMVGEGNECTGATTPDGCTEHIEEDPALARRFLPINIPEPSVHETMQTLRKHYKIHHNLHYERNAFIAAVVLSDLYISDRFLPDKAIDLVDKAGARVSTRHVELLEVVREFRRELRLIVKSKKEAGRSLDSEKLRGLHNREMKLRFQIYIFHEMNKAIENKTVEEVDIRGIVSSWTGIAIEKLVNYESTMLRKMDKALHKGVIGQDEAVKAVSRFAYYSLGEFGRYYYPRGTFIFYGPSGVGKSELAKALAANYFGSEEAVIQLDMREFRDSHAASKLIGPSPGHTKGGQLTEAIRRQPHTVVLFKEIEKAHLDVLNMILRILKNGRLADNKGRIVNFNKSLVIMTSNAGSSVIEKGRRQMGLHLHEDFCYHRKRGLVMEELKQWFGPGFLERIDEVIVFRQLTKLEVKKIADIKIKQVFDRLKAKEIELGVTERFLGRVVEEGYDSSYGARPLRRAIRLVEDSVTEKMVAREIKEGDSVTVDVDSVGNVVVLNGSNHWLIQSCPRKS